MKDSATRRMLELGGMALHDAAVRARGGAGRQPRDDGISAGVQWLCRAHEVTGRRGCSKGFSLVRGWLPAYPETTGYIIGTLLTQADRTGDVQYAERAVEMGDWEIEVQQDDGGVMEGVLTGRPKSSTVFNTGMVIHGWLDLHGRTAGDDYLGAAKRAGEYLRVQQDTDGAWRGPAEHYAIPHTYCARVSWALVRLSEATGDASLLEVARRQLSWVLELQQDNGWFASCNFRPGTDPNTHGIAYTLRGLLESGVLLDEQPYLDAVARTSGQLIDLLERLGWRLPATFDARWNPTARYECLTGTAQLGGVWLRLHDVTGEERFREAGLRAIERAASHQKRSTWPAVDGALPGSFPVYGRYAPLQFPNWATKFLVDSLLMRERVLSL